MHRSFETSVISKIRRLKSPYAYPLAYPYGGCLRWALKWLVFFAESSLFYRALLQKRHVILRSILIIATPYAYLLADKVFQNTFSWLPICQSLVGCRLLYIICIFHIPEHRIWNIHIIYKRNTHFPEHLRLTSFDLFSLILFCRRFYRMRVNKLNNVKL